MGAAAGRHLPCSIANQDNKVDDDHDGVADVDQIDAKELFQRKTQLVLTKCNPQITSRSAAS